MSLKKIGGALFILLFIILFGGVVYSYIENWSLLDGIYFSAVTVSTLGYGDLVPKTDLGKIFTIIYSLSGIAIGLYILTVMGRSFFSFELGRGHIKKVIIKKDINLLKDKFFLGFYIMGDIPKDIKSLLLKDYSDKILFDGKKIRKIGELG